MTNPPARAAVAFGSAKAGAGGSSCDVNVTCSTFKQTCQLEGPAKDLDASIRLAPVGNQVHAITWSADLLVGTQNFLVTVAFTNSCRPIGLPFFVRSGEAVGFPAGTTYVGAFPSNNGWQNLTWTLH